MKRILGLIVAFGACLYVLNAQPLNTSTPEADLKAAREAEATHNYYTALEKYEKAYEELKDKTLVGDIARMNFILRDYARVERELGRILQRDRKGEYTELRYLYAMALKANGKYADAIEAFKLYQQEGTDSLQKVDTKLQIAGCEIAKKLKPVEGLTANNIGKKANNPQTEASPSFNGGDLYFTAIRAKGVIEPEEGNSDWYAKVYTASREGASAEFGEPEALGTQINREDYHSGNVNIASDGRTMFFTRVQLENNEPVESKIFYSIKGSEGWGAANEVKGVNGDYIAKHPCEGELFGEKVLFFSANMPGNKGGFDLYYAPKKSDGNYGIPISLGDVLNTSGDDISPFYRDGKLYFSSNGHPTIGGFDVFESTWNGSVWSTPKLLPLGINSALDDQYYTASNDGYSGFLVSNRPGPNNLKSKTCCDDIYSWEIERIRVNLLTTVFRRKRKGEKENQPLPGSTVAIYDISDKSGNPTRVDESTNNSSNDFNFTLQPDRTYRVIATRTKYQPDTLEFNTVGVKKTVTIEKRLTLRLEKPKYDTIRTDEPIRLENIYYDYDDDKILPDAEDDLNVLLDLLTRYSKMKIELSSHTDSRGRDDYNKDLSQRRANSAKKWLVEKGIESERIVPKGYGESQLLNECKNGVECTEEKHRFNRRTEFKIIEGPKTITIERIEKVAPKE